MRPFKNADKKVVASGLAIALGTMIMLFVVINISAVSSWISTLFSYISSVFWGLAVAYLIRPFTKFVRAKLPSRIKKDKTRARISAVCSLILLLVVVFALFFYIPRAVVSIQDFLKNFDGNLEALKKLIKSAANSFSFIKVEEEAIDRFIGDSESLLKTAVGWLQSNYNQVLSILTDAVNVFVNFIIVLTIAVYALFDAENIKRNCKRIELALFGAEKTERINAVLSRGDMLMTNFLSSNIIDALIIGVVNFIFLTILDAPYTLVLSIILGVTNFVPTFGPVVGGIIGGLIIVLTDSSLLLAFILFTVILQQIDGNVLKPILFGDSTGLSGFWVMVAIVVGGNMFGILGMILGVPVVAFISTLLDSWLARQNGSGDLKAPASEKRKFSLSRLLQRKK